MKLSFLLFGLIFMSSCKQAEVEISCYPPYRKLDQNAERISSIPEKVELFELINAEHVSGETRNY